MKKHVHLIRHGITAANQQNCYYGHSDVPLAEVGIDIVRALAGAGVYPMPAGAEYYTSGLLRAEQTLSLIYGNVQRVKLDSLKELHFGDYEMKTHKALKKDPAYIAWINDRSGMLAPPGGESLIQFSERVKRGLQSVLDAGSEHSVVVCHGGVVCNIMMSCFDERSSNVFKWMPDPGHGYSVVFIGGLPVGYTAF
ncbi:MAG: histidine phosphatase family protein [Clostridiales bacterium]|nr:histidine phosphatase family protein [Clostridiales bacterium]